METKTVYFEKDGNKNTDETIALAKKRADELGIKTIVVATHSGRTAVKAVNIFEGCKIIAVTHAYGHRAPNKTDLIEENRKLVESKNGVFLSTTEAFGGVHQALNVRMSHLQAVPTPQLITDSTGVPYLDVLQTDAIQQPHSPPARTSAVGDIISATLHMFCSGMKVTCEIAAMAADAGLVRIDEDIISIGGTHNGANTAIVIRPANTNRIFETVIKEIICKPRTKSGL
jgi:uncharacterized protein